MNFLITAFLLLFSTSQFVIAQEVLINTQTEPVTSLIVDQQVQESELVLDVHALQIVLNDEHRQGVDWEAIVADFNSLPLKKENNPIWTDKKYRVSVGVISDEDYVVLLEALDTVGKLTQFPQQSTDFNKDNKVSVDILFPVEGIDISATTQKIHFDIAADTSKQDQMVLSLAQQLDTRLYEMKNGQRVAIPVKLTTQTDITVLANQTVVLGGLMQEEEITRMNKFPLLGDLPLVGLVFRHQGKLMQKIETVIFLTPRIKKEQ